MILSRPGVPGPRRGPWLAALALCAAAWACQPAGPAAPPASSAPASAAPAAEAPGEEPPEPAPEATPLPAGIAPILQPFTGDLDGMVKRRVIRVLTVQNPILYFVDRGRELGIVYEMVKDFEKELNKKLGNKVVTIH